jgi:hypothetical protein
MPFDSMMYMHWYADNLWLFVPVQARVKAFLMTIPQYPFQQGFVAAALAGALAMSGLTTQASRRRATSTRSPTCRSRRIGPPIPSLTGPPDV